MVSTAWFDVSGLVKVGAREYFVEYAEIEYGTDTDTLEISLYSPTLRVVRKMNLTPHELRELSRNWKAIRPVAIA